MLSAENFPLEVRTTGISMVNCSGRVGAICAQFVNGFLVGPPPHIEALLLVVTSVMVTGGIASRHVAGPRGDDASHPTSPRANALGHKRLTEFDTEDDDTEGDGDDLGRAIRLKHIGQSDHEATATVDEDEEDEDESPHDEMRRCLHKGDRSSS